MTWWETSWFFVCTADGAPPLPSHAWCGFPCFASSPWPCFQVAPRPQQPPAPPQQQPSQQVGARSPHGCLVSLASVDVTSAHSMRSEGMLTASADWCLPL